MTPPPAALEHLLTECRRRDASDIHLAPDLPAHLRVLEPQAGPPLSAAELASIAESLVGGSLDGLDRVGSLDGAVNAADGTRFRFNFSAAAAGWPSPCAGSTTASEPSPSSACRTRCTASATTPTGSSSSPARPAAARARRSRPGCAT